LDTIRFLASRKGGAGEIASVDNYGNTALHYATVAGRADVVALLLNEFNCNPNLQNADGDTCLHIACQESHLEVVKVLAAHHSTNRALRNKSGHTPLEIADTKKVDSVVQLLHDSTPLMTVEEPPAKKPRLGDDTELGPSAEGSSESHILVSDPTQSPLNAGPPLSQSSTSTGTEGQQNQQNIPESDVKSTHVKDEQLDLEDEGNEPGLSLGLRVCVNSLLCLLPTTKSPNKY
jgi:ankyrin repeat protein